MTEPLPHASILAYLQNPVPPPSYQDVERQSSQITSKTNQIHDDDVDEADEDFEFEGKDGGFPGLSCEDVFGTVVYLLVIMIVVVNIDMFVSQWGIGIGNWKTGVGSHEVEKNVELHFCLQPSHPPAPQFYALLPPTQLCETESLFLHVSAAESARLKPHTVITVASSKKPAVESADKLSALALGLSKEKVEGMLPDDLAEEGGPGLGKGRVGGMHAGFGGRWARGLGRG